uniref:Uncharacterized protein n=1 Tax=viral metagenome TaxID=1070528 RepID=A0A6M3K807_9ZZZZ
MWKKAIVVVSLILLVAGIGCVPLSYYITPATVDGNAVKYVTSAGVADVNDFAGYPNLAKAKLLDEKVDAAYAIKTQEVKHLVEDNNLEYSLLKKVTVPNVTAGLEREQATFGENGLVTLGLSCLGVGGLGSVIGLMRKRPGDITKEEHQQVLADVQGKSVAELSEKEKQLTELIVGFENLKKTFKPDVHLLDTFKTLMNKAQDTSTRVAVAEIKAKLPIT